jgi:TrpR family transcriptional regulator, trp operon repressor
MNTENNYLDELVTHLLDKKGHDELKNALKGLLTPAELSEVPKRLQIFNMLKAGTPQREIAKTLGVGIATVTRGSRVLQSGKI